MLLIFVSIWEKKGLTDFFFLLGFSFEQWTCISLSKNWNRDHLGKGLILLGSLQNFHVNRSQTIILNYLNKIQQSVIGLSEIPISLAFTISSFPFLVLQEEKRVIVQSRGRAFPDALGWGSLSPLCADSLAELIGSEQKWMIVNCSQHRPFT